MNKFFAMIVAVAAAGMFYGCSEKKEVVVNADQSFEKVKSAGELVVGIGNDFPPMGFADKDGNIVGFDIDLANEVGARLGFKIKLHHIVWGDFLKELNAGSIDCVWNGMSLDSARSVNMNVSDPYLTNRMVFTVRNKKHDHLDSLKGKKIGVQHASTAQPLLENSETGKAAKEVVLFDDMTSALKALEKGVVDAVYMDEVFAKYWNTAKDNEFVVLEEGLHNEFYAIGFRKKDQALRDSVNNALVAMKKDGKYIDISAKWFGK